jgi:hypothetical protein
VIYERPDIHLHCGDARYLAIRRSAIAYCRSHPDEKAASVICPTIVEKLSRCPRRGVALTLTCPSQKPGKAKPDCDRADVWMNSDDEILPYLGVVHQNGRWRVAEVGYDDLERP